jgi:23S rRNA pseudouridine2605 synthase
MNPSEQRLNKFLALSLGISRREADDLIDHGDVTIDDTVAVLGARITDATVVKVKGKPLEATPDFRYVMLNKPVGYVCSRRAQGDTPTIYELLPDDMSTLKPVGRLDKDSSGLILLTNDGDFAFQMTHPKFHKTKKYEITLATELAPLHQQMISDHGIELTDGTSKLSLERMSDTDRLSWLVTMHEGRNRQIRRTFTALGYDITQLHRTDFGSYRLDSLSSGETRSIDKQ